MRPGEADPGGGAQAGEVGIQSQTGVGYGRRGVGSHKAAGNSARGLATFARIDHGAEAARVGLSLRPMQLLVFGNPKGVTPLISAAPTLGPDLALKVLAWEGADGKLWITCNSPDYLGQRHGLDPDARKGLVPVAGLVEAALK